jgi:hypothetical protein
VLGGASVALQSLSNLQIPNSVTYLSGRFIYGINDGRFFCSAIDDGTSVGAAAFDVANLNPDNNVRVYAYNGYCYVFGAKSVEIWISDPSLVNYPFPYGNTKQTITLGLSASNSLAELDDGLVWIDNEGIVRYGVAGGSARISSHWVERYIEALSASDKAAIVGYAIEWGGHKAYVITSSSWTLMYDLRTKNWYERSSSGLSIWRVSNAIQFNGLTICGDTQSGKLYYLDPENPTEDGNPITMEVQCGHAHHFPANMIVDKLSIDVVTGIGLQTGDDADVNPMLLVDYSDDGGNTYEGETFEPLGPIGDYDDTIEVYRLGLVREKGRLWRFRSTVQALKAIIQAAIYPRSARPADAGPVNGS